MSKIKMVETLADATGKPQKAHDFMKEWEEEERQRKADQDRLIAQMRQDELQRKADNEKIIARLEANNAKFIEQHRADNAKFIGIVERELQLQHKQLELQNKQLELQNKQLRFLSWAIPVVSGILALLIILFNVFN